MSVEKESATGLLENLKKRGYRITGVRKRMVEILGGTATPISADEILAKLKAEKMRVHKTTVYRDLYMLRDEGVVQEIHLGDKKRRYEIPADHHHHLVCIQCKKIEDVSLEKDLDGMERRIASLKDFKIISHSLEFFGLCSECK